MSGERPPILGFCAWSGTGKTTLLRRLLPLLKQHGLRIGVIKHAHHSFDIDHPGKDSYELRKAGADQMLVASRRRMALVRELGEERPEPRLADALAGLHPETLDLILVEGFKHERYPKIELHRPSLGRPLLHPGDPDVIAVAADGPIEPAPALPLLDLNRPEAIAAFVVDYLASERAGKAAR